MDPQRWQRINEVFLEAVERDPAERDDFLASACGDDADLRAEVEALIDADPETREGFLEPAGVNAKQWFDPALAKTDLGGPKPASTVDFAPSGSGRSQHGRFLPGTKIADRYRIVSLLGKGGMGEVYRADDLRLDQTVALKFLPAELASDKQRLELFHTEVRLTRQISHPNVCRVYDIAEVDGQPFLSMEYVDGEDLGVLLRRIGRLPKDKGVQIAQQLCAGLAAAHDKGVLHRDLKPANIMLDGRGQARIADFGLARLTQDDKREIAGTPAYMAPEQLRHGEATIRSDLYALGLVLYELFTGKPAYKSGSVPEMLKRHEDSAPTDPSGLVDDMDPVVERVIMRCLEKDPQLRPKSAYEIAAALPGGDPLAAALAAGETPSPEMVAAAGGVGGLDPKVAGGLLGCVLIGLIAVCWIGEQRDFVERVAHKHPQVFAADARRFIKTLGYDETPGDSSWQFATTANDRHARRDPVPEDRRPNDGGKPSVYFWYRQSPRHLTPQSLFTGTVRLRSVGAVTFDDPPMLVPGMVSVRLDEQGRLLEFRAVPPRGDTPTATSKEPTTFDPLVKNSEQILGFPLDRLASTPPEWTPATAYDIRRAWKGSTGDGRRVRVEAGGFRGRLVAVRVFDEREASDESDNDNVEAMKDDAYAALYVVGMFTAFALVLLNLRRGRGDRRSALRLAIFAYGCNLLIWILAAHHVASPAGEFGLLALGTTWSAAIAFELWCSYIAFEPFIRRIWPQSLISWTRALDGRFRDPLVGRHLLIGVMIGIGVTILLHFGQMARPQGEIRYSPALLGVTDVLSRMLAAQFEADSADHLHRRRAAAVDRGHRAGVVSAVRLLRRDRCIVRRDSVPRDSGGVRGDDAGPVRLSGVHRGDLHRPDVVLADHHRFLGLVFRIGRHRPADRLRRRRVWMLRVTGATDGFDIALKASLIVTADAYPQTSADMHPRL